MAKKKATHPKSVEADGIPVHCAFTEIMDTDALQANPRNPNTHPDNQIEMLAKIIKYQGWRNPIKVSARSGFITAGHGRLQAAQHLGLAQVPVDRQEYAQEADEWADLVADNKIAELAVIDGLKMADIIVDLDQINFPMDITGLSGDEIENYVLGPTGDPKSAEEEWEGMPEFDQQDKNAYQSVIVHFKDRDDLTAFEKLVEQLISEKTKYIWYPENTEQLESKENRYEAGE